MAVTERWPALPYDAWLETRDTLHMWLQIVGKIAHALGQPLNHCWGDALQVTARGLSTRLLSSDNRTFAVAFDFVNHELAVVVSEGATRTMPLRAEPVADFYRALMAALEDLGLGVKIWTTPVELPPGAVPIPFENDRVHRSYDADSANRFWRIIVESERLLTAARGTFVGKASPAHFFWGGMDLALTRFSGKIAAPPPTGPRFMCDAYSHEVISHGFWPGSGPVLEPAFYAYAVPQPDALPDARVRPDTAYYHRELGEFILPYEKVRTADDPSTAIVEFVDSTYDAAARLAGWDHALIRR